MGAGVLLIAVAALAALSAAAVHDRYDTAHAAEAADDVATAAAPGALRPGAIAVADTANDRVRIFHPGGAHAFDVGSRGAGNGKFMLPEGVALDSDGTIAVADTGNDRIQVFYPNGTFDRAFGSHGTAVGQFDAPSSIAFLPEGGMVAVADTGNDRIQIFHIDGAPAFAFGSEGAGIGDLSSPRGVAVTGDRMVAVADTGNHRVQVFHIDGTPAYRFGSAGAGDGQFDAPASVDFSERDGWFAVADTGNDRVQIFDYIRIGPYDQAIEFRRTVGPAGGGDGQFDAPRSVSAAPSGNHFVVSDAGNRLVREFGIDGGLAGNFGPLGAGAGQVSYMRFHAPPPLPPPPPWLDAGPSGLSGASGASGASNLEQALPDLGGDLGDPVQRLCDDPGIPANHKPPECPRPDLCDPENWHGRLPPRHCTVPDDPLLELQRPEPLQPDPPAHPYTPPPPPPPDAPAHVPPIVDLSGAFAVVDGGNHRIQVFHPNGVFDHAFGSLGSGDGRFKNPNSAAYSPSGDRIAVADTLNHRV